MSEEHKATTDWVEPYLHADRKIEKIQDGMTTFLKEQLAAGSKMDRLMDAQNHLQNRFDKSSETGFKTFEMVKGIVSDIGSMKTTQEHHDKRVTKIEDFTGKYLVGMLVVAVGALITGIVSAAMLIIKFKGG